jgi:tRNA(adenine34) deaminase
MRHARFLAEYAQADGEVPVGAVIVADNEILGEGWNGSVNSNDATAHAEIVAIRQAGSNLRNHRLPNSTMYVTLEPCAMCAGAIVQARIDCVVFGASDPKAGAAGSLFNILDNASLNHRARVIGGVDAGACGRLISEFFKAKRLEAKRS